MSKIPVKELNPKDLLDEKYKPLKETMEGIPINLSFDGSATVEGDCYKHGKTEFITNKNNVAFCKKCMQEELVNCIKEEYKSERSGFLKY